MNSAYYLHTASCISFQKAEHRILLTDKTSLLSLFLPPPLDFSQRTVCLLAPFIEVVNNKFLIKDRNDEKQDAGEKREGVVLLYGAARPFFVL